MRVAGCHTHGRTAAISRACRADFKTLASCQNSEMSATAILQMDNRFCGIQSKDVNRNMTQPSTSWLPFCRQVQSQPADATYWHRSLAINAQWAASWGYIHLTYCARACPHLDGEPRHVTWCKIVAVMHAMRTLPAESTILYLDSDVYWNMTSVSLPEMLQWTPPASPLVFGCNYPYAACRGRSRTKECGTEWNRGLKRAPPNSGIMIVRNNARAREMLYTWWNTPSLVDSTNVKYCPEQASLWDIMVRHADFRRDVDVIKTNHTGPWPNAPSTGWFDCLVTNMIPKKLPSPIVQVDHFYSAHGSSRFSVMSDSVTLENSSTWCSNYVILEDNASIDVGLRGPFLRNHTCRNHIQ